MKIEQKRARQTEAGVQGEEDEGGLGFGGFIQFSENTIKAEAAFCVADTAFNSVALTGVVNDLTFDLGVRYSGFSAAQRRAGETDAPFFAIGPVGSGLVDFIRQHSGGIAAEFAPVMRAPKNLCKRE